MSGRPDPRVRKKKAAVRRVVKKSARVKATNEHFARKRKRKKKPQIQDSTGCNEEQSLAQIHERLEDHRGELDDLRRSLLDEVEASEQRIIEFAEGEMGKLRKLLEGKLEEVDTPASELATAIDDRGFELYEARMEREESS